MPGSVIDTLITEFKLNPSDYVAGSKQVTQAAKQSTEAIEGQRSILGTLGGVMKGVVFGAVGIGAGLLGAAAYAINSAADFATLTSKLEAVTGSAKRAKEVMSFVDTLSIPSTFTSEELATAALRLEAFGLATERYLPTAEKLATVFGEGSDAILQYVNALGYIKGGRFGEAFESLAGAGISREALTKRGLSFNNGGEYQGGKEEALSAVTAEVESRFGKLSKAMQDGPAAKFASVLDQIGRLSRQAGASLLTFLLPVVERVSGAFDFLAKSKIVEQVGGAIASAFSSSNISNGLLSALAWIVVIFQNLPKAIGIVESAFSNMGQRIERIVRMVGAILIQTFIAGPLVQGVILLIEGFIKLRKAIQAAGIAAVIAEAIATGGTSLATSLAAFTASIVATGVIVWGMEKAIGSMIGGDSKYDGIGDLKRQQEELLKQFQQNQGNGDPLGDPADDPGDKKAMTQAAGGNASGQDQNYTVPSVLGNIATNTRRTAEATEKQVDLNQRILGGGSLAQQAFSDVNLSRAIGRSRSGSKARDLFNEAFDALEAQFGGEMVAAERHAYAR